MLQLIYQANQGHHQEPRFLLPFTLFQPKAGPSRSYISGAVGDLCFFSSSQLDRTLSFPSQQNKKSPSLWADQPKLGHMLTPEQITVTG